MQKNIAQIQVHKRRSIQYIHNACKLNGIKIVTQINEEVPERDINIKGLQKLEAENRDEQKIPLL